MIPSSDMEQALHDLIELKRFEKAEELLRKALSDQRTRQPRVGMLLAKVLLKSGQRAEAETVLRETVRDWPKATTARYHYAKLLTARRAFAEVAAVLEGVAADRLPKAAHLLLARANLELGRFAQAAGALQRIEPPWPEREQTLAFKVAIELILRDGSASVGNFLETARDACEDSEHFDRQFARKLRLNAYHCWLDGNYAQAVELLKTIMAYPPFLQAEPEAALQLADIHIGQGEHLEAVATLGHLKGMDDEALSTKREWLLSLCRSGDSGLAVYPETGAVPLIEPAEQLFDGAVLHYRFGSDRCVVWFNGIGDAYAGFYLTKALSVMQKRGISVFAVTDKRRVMAMAGIDPFFPDRAATREALQRELALRRYLRIATMGISGAGFSALLYGTEMGVDGILGFAAVTRLPEEGRDTHPQALKHRAKLIGNIEVVPNDSRALVTQNSNTPVFLNYSEYSAFDAEQSSALADLPNVTLWPEPYDHHNVCEWLTKNELFCERLNSFLDAIGWQSPVERT